jgi:uncharacterized protein
MNRMAMTLQTSGASQHQAAATAPRGRWTAGAISVCLLAAAGLPSAVFVLLVAAPLLEEIVFRVGLQTQLLRHASQPSSTVLTALAFAAAHVAVRPGVLSTLTFFPALAIGVLFARQRRVLPCIALHTAFNATWLALFEFTV